MKRVFAFFLVTIMMVTLCSCGEADKYVGTYEHYFNDQYGLKNDISLKKVMVLNKDGTGEEKTVIRTAGDDFKEGQVLGTSEITWSVEDEYLVVSYKESKNYREATHGQGGYGGFRTWDVIELLDEPKVSSYTNTYELKGNNLFNVKYETASYTKLMEENK